MPEAIPLSTLQTILKSDYDYRSRRHAEWNENYLLFRSRVITNRLTQRQSMNVPYVKETVRRLVGRTAVPPDVYLEELSNDKQKELLMNELWAHTAEELRIRILDIVDRKQEALYGRSNMKVSIQRGKVHMSILDPQDVLFGRFMRPWDVTSARHVTHVGIYKTLSELERNPLYDKEAVKKLKLFFATKTGLIKANDNAEIMAARAERMRFMGVPDVLDPQLGKTYVEINETQIKVPDEKEEKDFVYVVPVAENHKLAEKKMLDVLGINRFNICSWAGDVEATDIYSDGAADMARPMNQLANVRISQKAENGTLVNFGMQFYNSTGKENWSHGGYTPAPFAFFPFPGDPNTEMKRVDIREMADVFQELDWYRNQIESVTAASAIIKGESEEQRQNATEIQVLAAEAAKRITSSAPLSEQYWQDIGELFGEIVNANPELLDAVTLYKKGPSETVYPYTLDPKELASTEGYRCRVTACEAGPLHHCTATRLRDSSVDLSTDDPAPGDASPKQ